MKKYAFTVLLACALAAQSGTASATPHVLWSNPAVGCLPGSAGTTYGINGSTIISNSGTFLALFCPVTAIAPTTTCNGNPWQFTFAYKSNLATYPQLYPFLLRVSRATGVETIIANTSSTAYNSTTYQVSHISFSGPLDFENYTYYVQFQAVGNTPGHPAQIWIYYSSISCDV